MTAPPNGSSATAAGEIALGDMTVRRIGFGAMRLTGPGIWGEPEDTGNALGVLRRALELDVNMIDTADSYGPEVSENLIAEALHPYPDGVVIATKGGMTRDGPNSWHRNGRPEHLRKALEGSLKRLRLDAIDLYQLHAPDPDVPFEESVGTLAELRNEGKVRNVGLSNVNPRELESAEALVPVVSVQNRYNLDKREWERVIEVCEQKGIAFIPWFPIDAGRLANPGSALDEAASAHGATHAQVALAWLLQHSPAMLPIPGTSSVAHLEENVAAASIKLSDEEMQALDG